MTLLAAMAPKIGLTAMSLRSFVKPMPGWLPIVLIVAFGAAMLHFLFLAVIAYEEVGKSNWQDPKLISQKLRGTAYWLLVVGGGAQFLVRIVFPQWERFLDPVSWLLLAGGFGIELIWAVFYSWFVTDPNPLIRCYARRVCGAVGAFVLVIVSARLLS